MRVAMPTGDTHGWGIAGSYLGAEIGKLQPIEGVTLHSIAGHHFAATFPEQWNAINIGYCFFESEIIAYRHIPEAARRWDYIVAGSSWCEYHLRIAGMGRTSTILQGIDPMVFSPLPLRVPDGRFIVFSGGKFEFRKGHDLVIAAMRVFMASHSDVWLACSWHNHWPMSIKTMEQSRLINFDFHDVPCENLYLKLLADNGIPLDRVILYPVQDNRLMHQTYANSDVGLFPNRCEGGNNMVMCEYMACGRPVIASTMTGHMDVISQENALCLTQYEPIVASHGSSAAGVWFEPSVDETVELLQKAYTDRKKLGQLAEAAGTSMRSLSWQKTALQFHDIARQLSSMASSQNRPENSTAAAAENPAALFDAGDYDKAADVYLRLLQVAPLDPDLHNNIGTVLDRLGRYAESVLHYEKALALRADFKEARFNLANTLKRMGDVNGAICQLEMVTSEHPSFINAWQNLALCRLDNNDRNGSVSALERVLQIDPACTKSRADMGEILVELGRYTDALNCFERVLDVEPENDGVLNSKGNVLQLLNRLDEAEECYLAILRRDPGNSLALNNMGVITRSRALPEQAISYFDRALASTPEDDTIVFNRSLTHLVMGNFKQGWLDYEARFASSAKVGLRHTAIPRWRGEDIAGKTILVWCEQGYGDSIQFIRYARLLSAAGARVVVEAQDERIAPLLLRAAGVAKVLLRGQLDEVVDIQIPLLSIPGVIETIPGQCDYLDIRSAEISHWRSLLPVDGCLKVGIAWSGRATHENDRNRSITPGLLAPLAGCQDVTFVSLQFSSAAPVCLQNCVDLTSSVQNFIDSAALISGLDLVVTVDSAVAHLAGALNVPVWILLPFDPDWRWLLGQDKTAWYPSARLFRQEQPFQWHDVVARIARELKIVARQKKLKL